jgi:hypothetical protein
MSTTTKIVLGKDLSQEELDIINYNRKIEFNSSSDIHPLPGSDDWEKPYVLVRNEEVKLVSFGRMHYLRITFRKLRRKKDMEDL